MPLRCMVHATCLWPGTVLSDCGACLQTQNYEDWKSAHKKLQKEFDKDLLESYKPALSILFNIFILTQVCSHTRSTLLA